jgi:hypothetical protein
MWDLWWAKWHWGMFSTSTSVSPCQFPFHRLLHIHHHLSSGASTIGQLVADVITGFGITPPKKLKKYKYMLSQSPPCVIFSVIYFFSTRYYIHSTSPNTCPWICVSDRVSHHTTQHLTSQFSIIEPLRFCLPVMAKFIDYSLLSIGSYDLLGGSAPRGDDHIVAIAAENFYLVSLTSCRQYSLLYKRLIELLNWNWSR